MAQGKYELPGDIIVDDKNRSELQSTIQFSASIRSSGISIANPKITFTLSASQTWSAQPDSPLTICTRHTPIDAKVPGRAGTGSSLGRHIASLQDGSWKPLVYQSPALRHNWQNPEEEDWQDVLGFVTIPSLESGKSYSIDRDIDISSLDPAQAPKLSPGGRVQFKLVDWTYTDTPGIEWWNWGDLNWNLKGKRLGYRGDPKYNDKNRKEERKHLPDNLVLGYDNWKDEEDDEGDWMVRLQVGFDDTPMSVEVVE